MKHARIEEVRAALARYEVDHWGRRGPRPSAKDYATADPSKVCVELGKLVRIVYRTRKGNDVELTDYDHAFARPYPVLAFEPGAGLLLIAGGSYRVEPRGIVG
jgi:hypothetical protein